MIAFISFVGNALGNLLFGSQFRMRSESKYHTKSVGFRGVFAGSTPHIALLVSGYLIKDFAWYFLDPVISVFILASGLLIAMPLSRDTGRVLLQATPISSRDIIHKTLREASTVEGVLEIKNEHFWTHSPGVVVGSLIVRIRGDADEQAVLSAISPMFSGIVTHLTIQVEKSDWESLSSPWAKKTQN